jgi:hypothetical protein
MLYLKRFLWLSAWSVWLWLGFGLYRELPRDFGPVVSRLPFRPSELVAGFVGDSTVAVTFGRVQKEIELNGCNLLGPFFTFRRWDVKRGSLINELGDRSSDIDQLLKLLEGQDLDSGPFTFSPNREFVDLIPSLTPIELTQVDTGVRGQSEKRRSDKPLLFDIVNGKFIALLDEGRGPIYHPHKPWAIFWSVLDDGENYVIVVDLRSGRRLFEWREGRPVSSGRLLCPQPFFIGEDRVGVISTKVIDGKRSQMAVDNTLEVWSLPQGERPLKTISGVSIGTDISIGTQSMTSNIGGRVAWHRDEKLGYTLKVFDVDRGGEIFCEPNTQPRDRRRGFRAQWRGPVLSHDGRTVLNLWVGKLFDIDTHKLLWSANEHEYIAAVDDHDRFEMHEEWTFGFKSWAKTFVTFAVRRLSDGGVQYRTWKPTLQFCSSRNSGEALTIIEGNVFELPPRVNYPLLTLCQSVLALPLILLWAILRWRRKRKAISAASA